MAVLIAAPLLMQLGLPGPFYVLDAQPDARVLFEFPIVLRRRSSSPRCSS